MFSHRLVIRTRRWVTVVRRARNVKGAARRRLGGSPLRFGRRSRDQKVGGWMYARIKFASPINSPKATLAIARKASVTAAQRKPPASTPQRGHHSPPRRGPPAAAEQDPPAGASPLQRACQGPGAALFVMALYYRTPHFCSFLGISSILTSAAGQQPTAGERARPGGDAAATAARPWAPGQPLRSPRLRPGAAADRSPAPCRRRAGLRPAAPRLPGSGAPARRDGDAAPGARRPRPGAAPGHRGSRSAGDGCPGPARRQGVGRARPEGASGGGGQRARRPRRYPASPSSQAGGVGAVLGFG